jgi:2-methylisocitrate lyase-like PEP mutase family enzyme
LAACCPLPVLADADTGYGNAVNVYHTTRAFEQAGVAGLMIEDQTWPKRCGHMHGKDIIPAEEMVEKVHAMGDARRDPALVLMARTDAFATHGLPEVLRRLTLYAEAGADLLFADALVSASDIATVARHVPKPLCVNMGFGIRSRATTPLIAPAQLQALGVAVVIYPRLLTACAIQGMKHGIAALRDAMQRPTVLERPELAVSFEELNALVGFAELQERERRYATP